MRQTIIKILLSIALLAIVIIGYDMLINYQARHVVFPTPAPLTSGSCKISGCSKELCSDRDLYSICNFKAEYSCYQTARCERQKDNQCGWTQTAELTQCLKSKR